MQEDLAAGLEQLSILNTGGTNLLTRATPETTIDMLPKRLRRTLQPSLRHSPHQIKPPAWSIILIPGNDISRARLQTQATMNTRQQLVSLTRQGRC